MENLQLVTREECPLPIEDLALLPKQGYLNKETFPESPALASI